MNLIHAENFIMYLPENMTRTKGEFYFRSVNIDSDIDNVARWLAISKPQSDADPQSKYVELIEQYTNILKSDCSYAVMALWQQVPIFLIEFHHAKMYYSDHAMPYEEGDYYVNLLFSDNMPKYDILNRALMSVLELFSAIDTVKRIILPDPDDDPVKSLILRWKNDQRSQPQEDNNGRLIIIAFIKPLTLL